MWRITSFDRLVTLLLKQPRMQLPFWATFQAHNRGITNGHNYFLPSRQKWGWEPPSPYTGRGLCLIYPTLPTPGSFPPPTAAAVGDSRAQRPTAVPSYRHTALSRLAGSASGTSSPPTPFLVSCSGQNANFLFFFLPQPHQFGE